MWKWTAPLKIQIRRMMTVKTAICITVIIGYFSLKTFWPGAINTKMPEGSTWWLVIGFCAIVMFMTLGLSVLAFLVWHYKLRQKKEPIPVGDGESGSNTKSDNKKVEKGSDWGKWFWKWTKRATSIIIIAGTVYLLLPVARNWLKSDSKVSARTYSTPGEVTLEITAPIGAWSEWVEIPKGNTWAFNTFGAPGEKGWIEVESSQTGEVKGSPDTIYFGKDHPSQKRMYRFRSLDPQPVKVAIKHH